MVKLQYEKFSLPIRILLGVVCLFLPPVAYYFIFTKREGTVGSKIVNCIAYTVLWIFAASLLLFVFWAVYNSLKDGEAFFYDKVALPETLLFSNYLEAYELIEYNGSTLLDMFFNSVWYSAGSSFLTIFMHAVTGYIFAKYDFPFKETAFKFILFTLALPIVGSLPSLYKIVYFMEIEESPLFLITSLGGFGSNFLIMYSYFKGIDKTYMEAADMDGASRFGIFFKIMLPLAVAPCLSLFLLTFIGQWNNYETILIFLDTMPTLSTGLYYFQEEVRHSGTAFHDTVNMAGVLMASIPVVILVTLFGDKIMSNVSMGGIKG